LAPKGQEDPDPLVIVRVLSLTSCHQFIETIQTAFLDAVLHPNAVDDRKGAVRGNLQPNLTTHRAL
jgi:hypothetical protein